MGSTNGRTNTRIDGIKKIGGNVPASLHTRVKVAAATRAIDLTEWMIEAFEEKLARERSPKDAA